MAGVSFMNNRRVLLAIVLYKKNLYIFDKINEPI